MAIKKNALYRLTDGDKAIIEAARKNNDPNIFLNYYMRNEDSGTWYRPVTDEQLTTLEVPESIAAALNWRNLYDSLVMVWDWLGKPFYFGPDKSNPQDWRILTEEEFEDSRERLEKVYRAVVEADGTLVFHYPHGALLLPWQLRMYQSKHPLQVCPGGYGCVAPDTLVYDAEIKAHVAIADLARLNKAPLVMAWTGSEFTPVRAGVPWLQGEGELYCVATNTGRAITVTKQHKFLTPSGEWKELDELKVGDEIVMSSSYNPSYDTEKIAAIEFVRTGEFYDLNVPFYENYLAQGFVNHNSGKTFSKVLTMCYEAATKPGYRGLALAPNADMAREFHGIILGIIEGTLFSERFLVATPMRPRPTIVIGNDAVGETKIECFPLMDGNKDNSRKLLTLTADEALIDQAEQMEDLDTVIRNVGSRFRGIVRGRPRKGQITLVANSADNQALYDLFDESKDDPDYIWAYSPGTFENTYLTVADLLRYEKQVGKDENSRRMYLKGERPIGSGEHFPAESLQKCRARYLDEMMTDALNKKLPGYKKQEAQRVAIHHWETPYDPRRRYMVCADPGWGNPPSRNAAAQAVFDYTDFPRLPARLVAFDWTFGHGSPNPWMAQFTDFVMTYKAVGMNGFDATGFQSGYERMTDMHKLLPNPVSLAGQNKYIYLNLTKKFFADGLFEIPSIPHLFSQLAKYRLPDDGLRQDIVMMLLVASAMLEPLYYIVQTADEVIPFDPYDRYSRDESDRYSRADTR
jgi:hypothetical protein